MSDAPAESPPFFQNGLRFECQPNCGACCARPGAVEVNRQDTRAMAKHLGLGIADFRRRFVQNDRGALRLVDGKAGACPFLGDDMRCRVYPVRPAQCRTYPFWPEILGDASSWEWEGVRCPGIDKGKLIGVDEILALSSAAGRPR